MAQRVKNKPELKIVVSNLPEAPAVESVPEQVEMPFAIVNGEPVTQMPKDLYIPPQAMEVFLEAFEGPLDLLLYLIRRQNLNILDIPLAEITRQYMQYIEVMTELQLELAGEYMVMAATLAEIKSRMLLPRPKVDQDGNEEDPRAELVRRLQEYERFKRAAEGIDALPRLERDVWTASADLKDRKVVRLLPTVTLQEMLLAFKDVVVRSEMFAHHHIQRERLSVRARMGDILTTLEQASFVEFVRLFRIEEGRMGVTVTFMALLELVREGLVEIVQAEPFAPIHVRAAGASRKLHIVADNEVLADDQAAVVVDEGIVGDPIVGDPPALGVITAPADLEGLTETVLDPNFVDDDEDEDEGPLEGVDDVVDLPEPAALLEPPVVPGGAEEVAPEAEAAAGDATAADPAAADAAAAATIIVGADAAAAAAATDIVGADTAAAADTASTDTAVPAIASSPDFAVGTTTEVAAAEASAIIVLADSANIVTTSYIAETGNIGAGGTPSVTMAHIGEISATASLAADGAVATPDTADVPAIGSAGVVYIDDVPAAQTDVAADVTNVVVAHVGEISSATDATPADTVGIAVTDAVSVAHVDDIVATTDIAVAASDITATITLGTADTTDIAPVHVDDISTESADTPPPELPPAADYSAHAPSLEPLAAANDPVVTVEPAVFDPSPATVESEPPLEEPPQVDVEYSARDEEIASVEDVASEENPVLDDDVSLIGDVPLAGEVSLVGDDSVSGGPAVEVEEIAFDELPAVDDARHADQQPAAGAQTVVKDIAGTDEPPSPGEESDD